MHLSSLVWKYWREDRTYIVLAIVASLLLTCHVIAYDVLHQLHAFVGHFSQMASALALIGAILLAMRTAKGEQSSGTQTFSSALPISMRTQATVRLLGSMLTLALPVLLSAVILSIATSSGLVQQVLPRTSVHYVPLIEREVAPLSTTLSQLWSLAVIQIAAGWQLLLLLCVVGNWLKTQSQIGFMGPVVALASMFIDSPWLLNKMQANEEAKTILEKLATWSLAIVGSFSPGSLVIHWGYGGKEGDYSDHQLIPLWNYSLLLFAVWGTLLAVAFVVNYGRQSRPAPQGKSWWQKLSAYTPGVSISFNFHSPMVSLIWLEVRKSVPMALLGLVLALLLACVEDSEATTLLGRVPHTIWIIGFLWSAIVGTGVYSSEMNPQLGNFWRSRPIDLKTWFAIKFVVGLLAVVLVLDGFAIGCGWSLPRDAANIHRYGMGWAYVVCMPITHVFIYSLSVVVTCWTRKPVVGGLVSLILFSLFGMALNFLPATAGLEPTTIYNNLLSAEGMGSLRLSQHGFPITYGVMYLSILPLAVAAYFLAKPLESYWQRYAR